MNYNKLMEEELSSLSSRFKTSPRLLLHSCCAPCSSHVIDLLSPYFNITIIYYNPNIEPYEEYAKRKAEEIRFIKEYPNKNELTIMDCDYDNDLYHDTIKGLESCSEGGPRCIKCYYLRMAKTAELASLNNFDYFATTLTVSPLKNSTKLNEIGEKLSKEYQIPYLYSDFKKKDGYKHSIELSKKYNLYRQDYCGCVYSKAEREQIKQQKNISQSTTD